MSAYDETDGWIFTREYHRWQDRQNHNRWRHGNAADIANQGWYVGLYSIKYDHPALIDDSVAATWPKPTAVHRLDNPESDE